MVLAADRAAAAYNAVPLRSSFNPAFVSSPGAAARVCSGMKVSVPLGLGHVAASSSPGLCYNTHRHLGLRLQLELTKAWP